jgi:hypothetical protein
MKTSILPPDPENMNDERADRAAAIIRSYQSTTAFCTKHALASLLRDLMHWTDRNCTWFENELAVARDYYAEETSRSIQILVDALNDIAAGKGDPQQIAVDALQSAANARSKVDHEEILF